MILTDISCLPLTSPELYFQVIDNDKGVHMRPMPGMISFSVAGPVTVNKCLFHPVTNLCSQWLICMGKESSLLIPSCAALLWLFIKPFSFWLNNEHGSKSWLQSQLCSNVNLNMRQSASKYGCNCSCDVYLWRSLKPL